MSKFLEGKKTYIGIIVTLAGFLGLGNLFGNDNIASLLDAIFQVIGISYAMYGNYIAHKKINALKLDNTY